MHTYKATIKVMANKGGDNLALLRGVTGVSGKSNKVFEFHTIEKAFQSDNPNHPHLNWNVWEVEDDGLYCLTYVDEFNKRQVMYYQKEGDNVGEVSLTEAMTLADQYMSKRKYKQIKKRREQRRAKRKVARQLAREDMK